MLGSHGDDASLQLNEASTDCRGQGSWLPLSEIRLPNHGDVFWLLCWHTEDKSSPEHTATLTIADPEIPCLRMRSQSLEPHVEDFESVRVTTMPNKEQT